MKTIIFQVKICSECLRLDLNSQPSPGRNPRTNWQGPDEADRHLQLVNLAGDQGSIFCERTSEYQVPFTRYQVFLYTRTRYTFSVQAHILWHLCEATSPSLLEYPSGRSGRSRTIGYETFPLGTRYGSKQQQQQQQQHYTTTPTTSQRSLLSGLPGVFGLVF